MLSAFKAKLVVELKQRDKSKIESILAYGDRLLIGLNTGVLRIYRVNDSDAVIAGNGDVKGDQATPRLADLLREEEKFSRRPIQQLARIKEANILISLSDGCVSFHDLQTYVLSERLEQTKGASCFAVTSNIVKDEETGIASLASRLAVAVKRKMLVWSWQDMELADTTTEVPLTASIKTIAWASGAKIIVGMDPGYVIVDVDTQQVSDIYKPGIATDAVGQEGARFGAVSSSGMSYMGMGSWIPKPMVTTISNGEMLLAKDVNTLFIDKDGKPLEKRQIPWAAPPEAIGYSYPYLLSLRDPAKGAIDVRNPETMSLLQSIPLQNATILHVPQPNISLAHAGKGFLVASDRCIWRMGALDYASQVDELVSQLRFDEAISLLNMLEDTLLTDKDSQLREIKIHKAQSLFDQQRYRDSLDLFAAASAPPERVIALYPAMVSGTLGKKIFASPSNANLKSETDAASLDEPKSGSSRTSSSKKLPDDIVKLEGRNLQFAVNELCAFLVQARTQLREYIGYDGKLKQSLPAPKTGNPSAEKPEFAHFIVQNPNTNHIDWQQTLHDVAILVDTTLFRAYMFARPQLAGHLFRLDNFCDPEVVEQRLYENERYLDLIDFLGGKKLHGEALKLLEKFGKGEADGEVNEALRGPRRMVAYLQQLPFEFIDLILQYAKWPLEVDPKMGMQIFLADTENAETLPRDRVTEFLIGIDPAWALVYLEHVIHELKDQTSEFHDNLIKLYISKLRPAPGDGEIIIDDESQSQTMEKLEEFLWNSHEYNGGKILRGLPKDDPAFYQSRAIVYGKLSQHKAALEIYAFQLKDSRKAEEYCNQVHLQSENISADPDDPSESQSIYNILLSLYLNPPAPHAANLDAALILLSNHGSRLPALHTISLLPTTVPIKDLESYFCGRMRAANSLARENAIVAALSGVEKSSWEAALLVGDEAEAETGKPAGRNMRVVLGEDRRCTICHKRFGRAAVRVYPNGEVVHYGCVERKGQIGGPPLSGL